MGRLPRIRIPGITFHVVQRGHNRERVFFDDEDYRAYLLLLNHVRQRYRTSVHAYVLMTNHVHLLMTSQLADGVSRTMQNVAGAYSRRVNGQQQRSGTLWEGRFSASPVDTEYYCLACYRYIELNPVRAGMAASPADYRWSSYHENIGRRSLSIVEPHPCFEALGPTPQERAARYRSLVHEHLPDKTVSAIRLGTNKNLPVGQQDFVQAIERSVGIRFGARDRGRPRAAD